MEKKKKKNTVVFNYLLKQISCLFFYLKYQNND